MKQIRKLVTEVHRRSLWQVLGIYAVTSWVIYQVVLGLYEGIGLPDWVPGTALVLLLIGLPIVLATAFVQEGAPTFQGDRPGPEPKGAGSAEQDDEAGSTPAVDERRTSKLQPRRSSLFTWQRAITGGVLAFAALGLAASGFMGMRALGIGPAATLLTSGLLEERDPILLADFSASTGDSALAMVATRVIRVDIEQSPAIRLVEPDSVAEVLERMRLPREAKLDEELAREVGVRGGWKAVIAGDIATAGGPVVVSARVVAAESGEVLAAYRETARDSTQVIAAVDRVSEKLRSKIGESLGSVRATPPLTQITSSSLPAIRKLFEGWDESNRGNRERAIALIREAIALDSAFAFAYRKLASELNNDGRRAEAVEAIDRALAHAERLTQLERLHVEGLKGNITGDDALAIRSYEQLLERFPSDRAALNNLALVYDAVGDFETAAHYMLRALHREEGWKPGDPVFGPTFTNAVRYLYNSGQAPRGDSVLELLATVAPDHPALHFVRARRAAARGEYEEAREHLVTMRELRRGSLAWQETFHSNIAALEALRGRIAAAGRALSEDQEIDRRREQPDDVLAGATSRAIMAARVLGDTAQARLLIAQARAETDGRIAAEDVPYLQLTDAYVAAGQIDSATRVLARFRTEAPAWLREGSQWTERLMAGLIALAEGRPADAIELFDAADASSTWLGYHVHRALAYEMLERPDSAAAAYESYLETPELRRALVFVEDPLYRAFVLERLADLKERAGQNGEAARYYAEFIELWDSADPQLQPRVEAARRALARLTREGGG